MKPVLMIHDATEDMFELPLANYTLTFDDGLFSQWVYLDEFLKIPTDKIFFVSTKFVCTGSQSTNFPKSSIAHDKAREGVLEDFMTVDQLTHIQSQPMCQIGCHGHAHVHLRSINRMVDRIAAIKHDTERMIETFSSWWNEVPPKFCFPYNENLGGLYTGLLRTYGFTEFYGRERIPIETLLRS